MDSKDSRSLPSAALSPLPVIWHHLERKPVVGLHSIWHEVIHPRKRGQSVTWTKIEDITGSRSTERARWKDPNQWCLKETCNNPIPQGICDDATELVELLQHCERKIFIYVCHEANTAVLVYFSCLVGFKAIIHKENIKVKERQSVLTASSGSINASNLDWETLGLYNASMKGSLRSQKTILVPEIRAMVNQHLTVIGMEKGMGKGKRQAILTSKLTDAVYSSIHIFSAPIKCISSGHAFWFLIWILHRKKNFSNIFSRNKLKILKVLGNISQSIFEKFLQLTSKSILGLLPCPSLPNTIFQLIKLTDCILQKQKKLSKEIPTRYMAGSQV